MGKYSDFKRVERDFYRTPAKAVQPLLPYLPETYTYCEPCVGGSLDVISLGVKWMRNILTSLRNE